jgi:hypothetical protein
LAGHGPPKQHRGDALPHVIRVHIEGADLLALHAAEPDDTWPYGGNVEGLSIHHGGAIALRREAMDPASGDRIAVVADRNFEYRPDVHAQ